MARYRILQANEYIQAGDEWSWNDRAPKWNSVSSWTYGRPAGRWKLGMYTPTARALYIFRRRIARQDIESSRTMSISKGAICTKIVSGRTMGLSIRRGETHGIWLVSGSAKTLGWG